jgi:hypothetical protein
MKFRNIAISFALLSVVGCKNIFEDNDLAVDGSTPYADTKAPVANNVYAAGEPFKMSALFSDKDLLKTIDVKLVRVAAESAKSESILDFETHPNINILQFDSTFANTLLTSGNYQLSIRTVDGRSNEGVQEIAFSVR